MKKAAQKPQAAPQKGRWEEGREGLGAPKGTVEASAQSLVARAVARALGGPGSTHQAGGGLACHLNQREGSEHIPVLAREAGGGQRPLGDCWVSFGKPGVLVSLQPGE